MNLKTNISAFTEAATETCNTVMEWNFFKLSDKLKAKRYKFSIKNNLRFTAKWEIRIVDFAAYKQA